MRQDDEKSWGMGNRSAVAMPATRILRRTVRPAAGMPRGATFRLGSVLKSDIMPREILWSANILNRNMGSFRKYDWKYSAITTAYIA
nr:hypothetical protein [Sphingomonas sp. Y57]